jgi:hypothetical protein
MLTPLAGEGSQEYGLGERAGKKNSAGFAIKPAPVSLEESSAMTV